jgi:rSAM/selenodomain-associated transferase 2
MRELRGGVPSISVVIPTLDEHENLRAAVESTRASDVEHIVVDGGSQDGTPEVARFLRARKVLASPAGRGAQMDAGYRASSGEVILFLHADTRLEPGWREGIAEALRRPRVMGGAFRLRFESERWVYRVLEWGGRLRCSVGRMPRGEQALFVRRKLLDQIGGVPCVPLFEDLDLVRAICENGSLAVRPERAWTSARRYERHGLLRGVARRVLARAGYALGLDRTRVARWYRRRPRG